jgi:hypothetical protein
MFHSEGKYHPSSFELLIGCLLCPTSQEPMELIREDDWAGFVQGETRIGLTEIEGLPDGWVDAFECIGLTSGLATWVSSLVGLPVNVVEACRILDIVEIEASKDPNLMTQAARISSLRLEIQARYRRK